MRAFLVALLTVFFHSIVLGTPQIPDKIIYHGKEYKIQTKSNYPVESYFEKHPDKRPEPIASSLWRGYVATFEIKGSRLYLKDIEIRNSESEWKSIRNDLFPNQESLKIDWFTGILVLPSGKIVASEKCYGCDPTYENYTLLEIDKGILKKEKTVNYKDFEKFKEEQFQAFTQTEAYGKNKDRLKKRRWTDKDINSLLRNNIIDYSSKILVE